MHVSISDIRFSEIHDSHLEAVTLYKTSQTIEKILALSPVFVLGSSRLFEYDSCHRSLVPSLPFRQLLQLLVQCGELDAGSLTASSLYDLNAIKSTRVGASYRGHQGHRATTEVTVEDWMSFYSTKEPQVIFAVAENPYIRLADQLRFTVLSEGKKASIQELIERISRTTFYFVSPAPDPQRLMSVALDEMGRHVYRVVETLKYLESL